MIVCVPVTGEGLVDTRWGRADRVAIAVLTAEGIDDWQEFEVGWGSLHDSGTEGSHHARVARFLRDHHVDAVVANHMGQGMRQMLAGMHLRVALGAFGRAREAIARPIDGEPN